MFIKIHLADSDNFSMGIFFLNTFGGQKSIKLQQLKWNISKSHLLIVCSSIWFHTW